MEIKVQPIFPTVIGIVDLGRDFTPEEMAFFKGLDMRRNSGNLVSIDGYVLDKPEMADLRKFCDESINVYMKSVFRPKNDISLKITQSWVNVTEQNEFHHKHNHANSAFSAAFYIHTHDGDLINFYKEDTSTVSFDAEEYDIMNSTKWWVPAKAGSMVMFPSYLTHDVPVKEHPGTRVSLSFNTFYVGKLGSEEGRTEVVFD